jgi:hypothetical protein
MRPSEDAPGCFEKICSGIFTAGSRCSARDSASGKFDEELEELMPIQRNTTFDAAFRIASEREREGPRPHSLFSPWQPADGDGDFRSRP